MFAVLILPACLLVAVNAAAGVELGSVLEQQHGSMQMLLDVYGSRRARDGSAKVVADQCFGRYMSEESDIVTVYNKAFVACSNSSETGKTTLMEKNMLYREELLKRGNSICIQMEACKKPTNVMEFFKCYYTAAGNNTQTLLTISMNSDSYSTNLENQLEKIENDYKVCVSTAHNKYLSGIFESNKALQACLAGQMIEKPAGPESNEGPKKPTTVATTVFEELPEEDVTGVEGQDI